jgi:hypothetical protein
MRVMRYRRRHRPSHRGIRTKKWRIRLPRWSDSGIHLRHRRRVLTQMRMMGILPQS